MAFKAMGVIDSAITSRFITFRKQYIKTTQELLAKEIGVNKKNISDIETGKLKPSQKIITHLSHSYKLNTEWLMKGTGDPVNNSKPKADSIANIQARISLIESQMRNLENNMQSILDILQKA